MRGERRGERRREGGKLTSRSHHGHITVTSRSRAVRHRLHARTCSRTPDTFQETHHQQPTATTSRLTHTHKDSPHHPKRGHGAPVGQNERGRGKTEVYAHPIIAFIPGRNPLVTSTTHGATAPPGHQPARPKFQVPYWLGVTPSCTRDAHPSSEPASTSLCSYSASSLATKVSPAATGRRRAHVSTHVHTHTHTHTHTQNGILGATRRADKHRSYARECQRLCKFTRVHAPETRSHAPPTSTPTRLNPKPRTLNAATHLRRPCPRAQRSGARSRRTRRSSRRLCPTRGP